MIQGMNITEAEYRQLQAKIDEDAKAQVAKVEAERVQNHQALDRIWAMIQRTGRPEADHLFAQLPTNGNGSEERAPFAMKDAIRKIIRGLGSANVTQPLIYREVAKQHSENIGHRNQQHVRGQIAGILTKMSEGEDPELVVVEEGSGHSPKVYRATSKLKAGF
jgi:hypothetical protein